jgi:hypothetical protein
MEIVKNSHGRMRLFRNVKIISKDKGKENVAG